MCYLANRLTNFWNRVMSSLLWLFPNVATYVDRPLKSQNVRCFYDFSPLVPLLQMLQYATLPNKTINKKQNFISVSHVRYSGQEIQVVVRMTFTRGLETEGHVMVYMTFVISSCICPAPMIFCCFVSFLGQGIHSNYNHLRDSYYDFETQGQVMVNVT